MNQEIADRYIGRHDAAKVMKAIAACKATGQVEVRQCNSRGFGSGFYSNWVSRYEGRTGMTISGPSETEEMAWLEVVVKLAKYKPGTLQMTSREFGKTGTPNVQCADGSLGFLEIRSRMEIRKIAGQYEVFLMERRYLENEEPYDIRQHPQDGVFETLADAAGYVGKFISDYEGAAAEYHDEALEACRERERNSV